MKFPYRRGGDRLKEQSKAGVERVREVTTNYFSSFPLVLREGGACVKGKLRKLATGNHQKEKKNLPRRGVIFFLSTF